MTSMTTAAALVGVALAMAGCERPSTAPAPTAETTTRAENARKALGPERTDVSVIAHGSGPSMLLAANGAQAPRMRDLSQAGVVFAACENTMKKKNVAKEDLLPFATTVDSGVAEVVRKQEAGWAYLKSSK